VTLGVRPEHWVIGEAGQTGGVSGAAVVDTVENLGSEEIVYCTVGGNRVSVRMARTDRVSVGDRVQLGVAPEHVHVFDRATGRRLEWVPDSEPSQSAELPQLASV